MLTLQELKRIVDVPGFGVKLPTAKQLRSRDGGRNIGDFIGKAEICHSKILPAGRNTGADFKGIRHQPAGGIRNDFPGSPQHP